jgi:tetratricopeptide (TPR) repeat protein
MLFRFFALISFLFFATFSVATSAVAQSLVIGNGDGNICYMKVKIGDPGRASTIRLCKKALTSGEMSQKDMAATHVNLGILHMRAKDYAGARAAYDKALRISPNLAEAYINLSANLIYMGDFNGALDAVNESINLDTDKMPEALYNRSVAYDNLRRDNEAYADLKRALALRPDWPPALRALENYDVVSIPSN